MGHINLWRTGAVIGLGFVLFLSFWPIADNRDLLRERADKQSAQWEVKEYKLIVTNQQENYQDLMAEFGQFQNEHVCKAK